MSPMIHTDAYHRLREENTRLAEELALAELAAHVVYDHVMHDVGTLRGLILEHLGPVVRGAQT